LYPYAGFEDGTSAYWDISRQVRNSTGDDITAYLEIVTEAGYGDYKLTWFKGLAPSSPNFTFADGATPLSIDFNGTATDSDGTIVKYEWDFDEDDVPDAVGQTPSFTYPSTGFYNVRMLAYDDDGLRAKILKVVQVD
jgi:PKD repeat protein